MTGYHGGEQLLLFTESSDYSGYFEIIEFAPGVSVVHVAIPVLDDNSYEELESFTVELRALNQSNQSGVKIDSSRSMARVDIIDDDSKINIIIAQNDIILISQQQEHGQSGYH